MELEKRRQKEAKSLKAEAKRLKAEAKRKDAAMREESNKEMRKRALTALVEMQRWRMQPRG
jgi:hypothetical protein